VNNNVNGGRRNGSSITIHGKKRRYRMGSVRARKEGGKENNKEKKERESVNMLPNS